MRFSPSRICPIWTLFANLALVPLVLILFLPCAGKAQEEYSFDLSEFEKRPFHLGGYVEVQPVLFGLDRNASLHKLRLYRYDEGRTLEEYNTEIQVDGSYEWERTRIVARVNSASTKSYLGWSDRIDLYEGYVSCSPSVSLALEAGKRQLKWGKGYAWNPVAFLDRPKNPDDPEQSMEGFVIAKVDYIRSTEGPLKSFTLTPVLIPVYRDVNEEFGEADHLNAALKIYTLLYDTDIDLILFAGGSRTDRYGLDFSRNITSNFEVHGEWACTEDARIRYIDANGTALQRTVDARDLLLGIRYLTEGDTTYIAEYYHQGAGFSEEEMERYYDFIDRAYEAYRTTGDESLLNRAIGLGEGGFGRVTPMRDYLYLRISKKEPFDILYFTPSITVIHNLSDGSLSVSPEVLYEPITNLELRLKVGILSGSDRTEYGEKQNDYRVEIRGRYYY